MIQNIEALHFRCLRYIAQPLAPFHILVGPNASGKTTFLDTIAFLGDLISGGLESAIEGRTNDLRDLVWQRKPTGLNWRSTCGCPKRKTTSSRTGNTAGAATKSPLARRLKPGKP